MGSSSVSILLGTGTGSFGAATDFSSGSGTRSVAVGNLNADAFPDLAVTRSSGNVAILLGTGTGSFGAATNFPASPGSHFVAIGDVNGDNSRDLAVANESSDSVSVLLGNGAGSFGAASNFAIGDAPQSVAIDDLNGDTNPDLALGNQLSDNISILLGTGTGTFGAANNFKSPTGSQPMSVATGDLNADTSPDLAFTERGADNVSVRLGNADPVTAIPASLSFPPTPTGTSSAAQDVTVAVPSSVDPTVVTKVSVEGTDWDDFVLRRETCTEATVAAPGTCQVWIRSNHRLSVREARVWRSDTTTFHHL